MTISRSRTRGDGGYTLIELLISMAIMLVVTGAIFELVNPGNATSETQPEFQDMQQRMRVATDTLFKDMVMAGAGPYQGPVTGSLMGFFAPVLPRCWGDACPSAAGATTYTTALTSTISLTYIPNSYSQTTISAAMPPNSSELKVNDQPNCPDGQELCGFYVGEEVIIFDSSGNFDTFTITEVQDDAGHLQHRGSDLNYSYDVGASVTQVQSATYYLDTSTHQLMHYDGSDAAPTPVADDVVGLTFEYFGDPAPPTTPKPVLGTANCLYDASGNYLGGSMETLSTGGASMAPLPVSMFTDGPWCGSGDTEFDADLFRVRRIRVTLRIETPVDRLRGTNTSLFAIPGTATEGQKLVPDLVTRFEVSPRNMNLSR